MQRCCMCVQVIGSITEGIDKQLSFFDIFVKDILSLHKKLFWKFRMTFVMVGKEMAVRFVTMPQSIVAYYSSMCR